MASYHSDLSLADQSNILETMVGISPSKIFASKPQKPISQSLYNHQVFQQTMKSEYSKQSDKQSPIRMAKKNKYKRHISPPVELADIGKIPNCEKRKKVPVFPVSQSLQSTMTNKSRSLFQQRRLTSQNQTTEFKREWKAAVPCCSPYVTQDGIVQQ